MYISNIILLQVIYANIYYQNKIPTIRIVIVDKSLLIFYFTIRIKISPTTTNNLWSDYWLSALSLFRYFLLNTSPSGRIIRYS